MVNRHPYYFGFVTILVILLTGCSAAPPLTSTSSSNPNSFSKTIPISNSNADLLFQSADKLKGSPATIQGKVFNQTKQIGDITAFQMYVGTSDNNLIVDVGKQDPGVNVDDFVEITGTVEGQLQGTNAFGAQISAPILKLSSLKHIDPMTIVSPSQKTIEYQKTQTQNGVSITVNKVEFAKDETRLYVTVKNDSNQKAMFLSSSTKAIQDGKQFDATISKHFEVKYPNISMEILPTASSSGIIVFDAMDPTKKLTFSLEAQSMDFFTQFSPYIFDVYSDGSMT